MRQQSFPLVLAMAFLIVSIAACTALPSTPRRVTLVADGEQRTFQTEAQTVRALLDEAEVTLEPLDRVTPPETTALTDGATVQVIRVTQHTTTLTETVPFERRTVRDANLAEGETRLLETGETGVLERVYRITEENGEPVARTLMQERLTRAPRDEVILIGVRPEVERVTITGTLAYLNSQDAWLMRGNNRARRRLTNLGDLDGRVFTLSPDSEHLLFTRAVTEAGDLNALWMINTREADAAPVDMDVRNVLWADWSPDGNRVAWTTATTVTRAPGWRGENDLWIARFSLSGRLFIHSEVLKPEAGGGYGWWGTRYTWSPDGERLAYSRPDEIGVVDGRRNIKTPLITYPAYRTYSSWAWHPELIWTPNGNFIAATLHSAAGSPADPEESPVFDLWMIEATGAYSAELASEVGMWATPRLAPDGATLLFGRARVPYQSETSAYMLCTIDRDGSNQSCFFPPEDQAGIAAPTWRWSPDGEQIAFVQHENLYLLSLATNTATPLTDEGQVTLLDWQ